MKNFIVGSYDIGFLCSNMQIEANGAIYDIKSEKHDFESGTSKLLLEIRNAHTMARCFIKKFEGASYHIEFFCSNIRIEAGAAIYDIKSKKSDFEIRGARHEGKSKLVL